MDGEGAANAKLFRFEVQTRRPSPKPGDGRGAPGERMLNEPDYRGIGRNRRAAITAVVAIALLVRVLYWLEARSEPLFQAPTGDAATYVAQARALAEDGILAPRGEPYSMAPLYPVYLRVLDGLGLGLAGARGLQFLLGAVAASLLLAVGWRWGGPLAGWVAGMGAAVYGPFVFFEGEILSISLAVFLLSLVLFLWGRSRAAPVAGLLFGVAALAQPSLLPAGLALAAAILLVPRWGWGSRTLAGLFLAGLLAAPAATLVRNLLVSGEPVLISVNGGVNFYIGNNESGDGTFHLPSRSGLLNRPEGLFTSAREVAENARGRSLSAVQVDRFWWFRGVDFWTTEFGAGLALFGRKLLLALNRVEIPNHYDYDHFRSAVPVLKVLPTMALLLPLGLVGLVLGWRRGARAGALGFGAVLVSVTFFFVTGRYRLPLAVFLWPGVGLLAGELWRRRRKPDRLLVPAAGALGLAFVVFLPLVKTAAARPHMLNVEGAALFQRGDIEGARKKFREVIEADPNHAEALNNLGRILLSEGKPQEAVSYFARAVQADPAQAETYFNLEDMYRAARRNQEALEILDRLESARGGRVDDVAGILAYRRAANRLALGDTSAALREFEAAVEHSPGMGTAWMTLTQLYRRAGRAEEALHAARTAVSLAPERPEARALLAASLEDTGDPAGAAAAYLEILKLGDTSSDTRYRLGRALVLAGKDDEAEHHLLAANQGAPHDDALHLLAQLYERAGRIEDARVAYEAMIQIKSAHTQEARRRLKELKSAPSDGKR